MQITLYENKSIEIDTLIPQVSSVSCSNPDSTYGLSSTLNILINFNKNVNVTGTPQLFLETGVNDGTATYTSGSGNSTLVFTYTVAATHTSTDLNYQNTNSLNLNGGTINDNAGNTATLALPATGSANSLAGNKSIVIDTTSPVISYVDTTTSTPSGNYGVNTLIPIQVVFSNIVFVTGVPQIELETGTTDAIINYSSGSGTNTLIFNYTVNNSHNTTLLSYKNTGSLTLNGGTIKDSANNNAVLTLPTIGGASSLSGRKSIVIDTTQPTVSSVSSNKNDGSYTVGENIIINIIASENVVVTGIPQLSIEVGAISPININYDSTFSSGNIIAFSYTVQSGHNINRLRYVNFASLTLNGGTIKDTTGNNLITTLPNPGSTGSLSANKNIVIDTTTPTVTNITSSIADDGTYTTGQTIPININYNKTVIVTGNPNITLETGATDATVYYSSRTNSKLLTFNYIVAIGENSNDLEIVSGSGITLNTGDTIKDIAGNNASLVLPQPGFGNALSTNKNIKIDTFVPTINSITTNWGTILNYSETQSNGTVTVNISNIENSQTVTITLNSINYTGSVFNNNAYITIPATNLQNLIDGSSYTIAANASDAVGNAATTLTSSAFTVDKTVPSVSSFTISSAITSGSTGSVSLVFNKAVTGFNSNVDITAQNGTLSTLTSTDNITWTGTFTPNTNIEDTTNVLTLKNSYTDSAGNREYATTSNYVVDTIVPSITQFSLSDSNLKIGETALVTLQFSEAVFGFNSNFDITVQNGILSTMITTNNILWTGTFTPTANIEDATNVLTLSTSYTDAAGNSGPSATTSNYIVNTQNDAPVTTNINVSMVEDAVSGRVINLQSGASDADLDTLTYTIVTYPSNGSLYITSLPNVTYNPTANFFGTDSFTYKVNDGLLDSNISTVTIQVTPDNDAPTGSTLT